jgi:hypothetical protein
MPVIIIFPSVGSYKNTVFRSDTSEQVPMSYGARIALSVLLLANGWALRASNPGEETFSATVQTDPGTHPTSSAMGTGFLSWGKAAGA